MCGVATLHLVGISHVLRGNRAFKPLRFGKKVGRKAICFLAIFIKPMMAKSMFGRTILGQSTLGQCWCSIQITTSKQLCVQDFTNRKRVVVVVSPPWLISYFCQQLGDQTCSHSIVSLGRRKTNVKKTSLFAGALADQQ